VKYVFSEAELSRAMWGQRAAARRRRFERGPRARLDFFLGAGGMSEWVMQLVHGTNGRFPRVEIHNNNDDDDDDDDEDDEDEESDEDLDYDLEQDDHDGYLGDIDPFTGEYIMDEEYEFRVQVLDQILTETLLPW
jgi:hypothetical protein